MAPRPPKTENAAAVLKVFAVLESLAETRRAPLADIAQRAMTSKTTAHRLLQTMVDLGYVEQQPETDRYGLTLKLFGLGARAARPRRSDEMLRRGNGSPVEPTGESINLGVMDDSDQRVAYIHKYDCAYGLSMQSNLDRRNPLHSTSLGKVLLAFRDQAEIEERLASMDLRKLAPRTTTDPDALRAELAATRARGYAEQIKESEAGVRCMAMPVMDHAGRSVAAISIAFPLVRFDETRKPEYVALLLEAGRGASAAFGYR